MLQDYKPVFATIPKAQDDSRSSRSSASDHYRDFKPAGQSSYDRYYDTPSYSLHPPPRRDGLLCLMSAVLFCDSLFTVVFLGLSLFCYYFSVLTVRFYTKYNLEVDVTYG